MKNKLKNKKVIFGTIIFLSVFSLIFLLSGFGNVRILSKPYDQAAPRAPQDLSIQISEKSVYLHWKENYEADLFSYLLYVRENGVADENPIFIGKSDNYLLEDLNPEKTYHLSLAAQDMSKNVGPKTNEISFVPDSSHPMNFKVAGWMQASADLEDARRSFIDNSDVFTDLSPFWYSAQVDGSIEKRGQIIDENVSNAAKNSGINIIPTITNNFDKDSKLSNLLRDSEKTSQHIENIINEVVINDYDGIDIDYENLDSEVKDQFTSFIKELSALLHEKNKLISVTVQAKKSDTNNWDGAGAMNFKKIGKEVDQFRVMTYDYSRLNTDPGPISPVYWFKDALEYAKTKVPQEKIMAGIPTYAYQWCTTDSDDCTSKGLTWDGVQNIISQYDPVLEWHDLSQSPWFLYVDNNNNTKVVYYENHQSIDEKLKIVKEMGLGGIAIWRLGSEDLQNYEVIREKLGKKVKPAAGIKVSPLDEAIKITWDENEDQNIKGYRLTIKEKADIEINKEEVELDEMNAQELLDKIKNGEYSYADSLDDWEEKYVDIYEENEYTIEKLENGKTYYLSLMTLEWNESLGGIELDKEDQELRTSQEITAIPSDQYFPGTIEDLKIIETGSTSVNLEWTNTGDDYLNGQADQFDIRYLEGEINENNFNDAVRFENTPEPLEPIEEQSFQVSGLEPGKQYNIAMKVIDEAGNYSELSNPVTIETIDNIAPNIPTSIAISSLDREIFVKWETGSEDDIAGYKIFYKKESSYYDVIEINASETNYSIKNLDNGFNYYVSMSVYDYKGNESVRSEDVQVMPSDKKNAALYKNTADKYYEQIKASLVSFSQRLFNDKAIPFIVVLSVLVVNFFIYQGIKREINKKSQRKLEQESSSISTVRKTNRVVDLKNIKKTIK